MPDYPIGGDPIGGGGGGGGDTTPATYRTNYLIRVVQQNVGKLGSGDFSIPRTLWELDQVQKELCRLRIMDRTAVIALEVGVEQYALEDDILKIATIIEPVGWENRLVILQNSEQYAEIRRDDSIEVPPRYVFPWRNELYFWPAPDAVEELTILYYGAPTATLTKDSDPQIGQEWDQCLIYGATHRIALSLINPVTRPEDISVLERVAGTYAQMFEEEKARQLQHRIGREFARALHQVHWSDEIGY